MCICKPKGFHILLTLLKTEGEKPLDCCVSPLFVLDPSGRLAELERKNKVWLM